MARHFLKKNDRKKGHSGKSITSFKKINDFGDTDYPHDGRADKDSYPHDRHNQYSMSSLQLWLSFSIDKLALIDHTSF